jgi:hypothetical protein
MISKSLCVKYVNYRSLSTNQVPHSGNFGEKSADLFSRKDYPLIYLFQSEFDDFLWWNTGHRRTAERDDLTLRGFPGDSNEEMDTLDHPEPRVHSQKSGGYIEEHWKSGRIEQTRLSLNL